MEDFRTVQPSQYLQPYVKQYWFLSANELIDGKQRSMPSGCIGLSFKRSGEIFSIGENRFLPSACIFGQSTVPSNFHFNSFDLIMVLFQPLGANAFFDISMNELKNKNIDIRDLSDPGILELEDRLMNCFNDQQCVDYIEQFLLERLICFDNEKLKRLYPVLRLICSNTTDIGRLANEACLGYKQFKRLFSENMGINPKEYIQIYRFSKSLNILQTIPDTTLTDLAYACGYYDKSHLIKDYKSLSGYTPTELMKKSDPYSPDTLLFQSFFINSI